MALEDHTVVKSWTEEDLQEIPEAETDDYEYKSSRLRESAQYRSELKHKLCKAASAFWNTGGGIFIAGVDDDGKVDGGLPRKMGRQKLRDWVDQALQSVMPVGPYSCQTIKAQNGNSQIEAEHVVLVVAFGESQDLPHMAHDNRYYVRAGGHSNPANHYLVEAIRARRGLRRPILRGLVREHPQKPGIAEFVLVAVNEIPALNVHIDFEPLPDAFARRMADELPLQVPVIDVNNPFRMDITTFTELPAWFGEAPMYIQLHYEGMLGNDYNERQKLDGISPSQFIITRPQLSNEALDRIAQQLETLNQLLTNYLKVDDRA